MVTLLYGLALVLAFLVGGATSVLLTAMYYHWLASQQRRFEQEIARDAELYAASRAKLQRCGDREGSDAAAP